MSPFTPYPRYYVFCDESGTGGELYYGFGALFMDYNRRGDFCRYWEKVQHKSPFRDEVKWSGTNSKKLNYYKHIVDFFFRHPWMRFHCIRIEKSLVDKNCHNGSYRMGERKHYTMFLANKMQFFSQTSGRHWFRIKADRMAYSYPKASEAMQVVGKHMTENARNISADVLVDEENSKDWTGIQICDLLLGACLAPVQRAEMTGAKLKLNHYIASKLGEDWDTLKYDTMPKEWKFNIWHWKPQRKAREWPTKDVVPFEMDRPERSIPPEKSVVRAQGPRPD